MKEKISGKFMKNNKKAIIDSFYNANVAKDKKKLDSLSKNSRKYGVGFLVLAIGTGVLFAFNVPAAIIGMAASLVVGGAYGYFAISSSIIEWKRINEATDSYYDVLDMTEILEEEYHAEVRPVLSSHLLTKASGEVKSIDTIVIDEDQKEIPSIVDFVLADGSTIVAQNDYFINLALHIDDLIFTTQYDGYKQDMYALHRLIKDYLQTKSSFKTIGDDIDVRESLLLKGLGEIYTIVKIKVENYHREYDGPILKLTNNNGK